MTGRLLGALRHAGAVGLLAITLVLTVGLFASWHAGVGLNHNDQRQADMTLDRSVALSDLAVRTEIHRYLDALRTVAAAVGAHQELTRDDFAATTAPLRDAGLVGATSVVLVVGATDEQIPAVQQYWRVRGDTDLTLHPVGASREHLFSVYARPLDGAPAAAVGTDLSQTGEPTGAMNESRRSGAPTVSDTYVLLRDRSLPTNRQQLSFALSAPAYGVPDADGRREFKGWVLMGLRGQNFIGGVLRDAAQGLIDAELWADNAGGQETRVARIHQRPHQDLRRELRINVANRQWSLVITASSGDLRGSSRAVPWVIGIGGSLSTLLLAGLLWGLISSRERARTKVASATAGLLEAERTASRQVALLNGILERISDGVGVVDENGDFLVHNPAAQAMLGIGADVNGADKWQAHYGIYRPDGITPFPAEELPLVRALAGEFTDDVEMLIRNAGQPDGVLLSVNGRPLDVDGHRGAIAVFHDVTAVREREADLAAFAGIVAHDLKSPLTVIAAHAEMASDSLETVPEHPDATYAKDSIVRISAGAVRMRRLIDDLLAYTASRDAALKIRSVDLTELVADVIGERINHLRNRPDVYVGPLPYVDADPGMLRHVLDNLVGNALKYVLPGRVPKVDISASTLPTGWVRIEVADRGIGIPDADKPRVFESFHRAHLGAAYGGTGLGLAICRRIVDRHGGSISVADNPGGGSRFTFTLPVTPTPQLPAALIVKAGLSDHEYV